MIGVGLGLLEARWWYFLFPGGRGHWDSHRFCPTLPPAPAGVVYYTATSPPPPKCFQALLVQTLCGCCCNQITSPQMPDSPLSTPQITPTPSEANNTMCLENRRCSSGPSAYRLDSVIWTERLLEFSLCKSRLGHMLRLDCGGGVHLCGNVCREMLAAAGAPPGRKGDAARLWRGSCVNMSPADGRSQSFTFSFYRLVLWLHVLTEGVKPASH